MSLQIVVVENFADWKVEGVEAEVVHVDDYLTGKDYFRQKNIQVVNLCRSYRYLSVGYYCSLLAEARGHRALPSVKTMLDLSRKSMYLLDAENLEQQIQKAFRKHLQQQEGDGGFEVDVYFGRCNVEALAALARQIFEVFPCPLLRVGFQRQGKWRIAAIKPLPVQRLDGVQRDHLAAAFAHYRKKRWRAPKGRAASRYDIAILHDPNDPQPPSNSRALNQFIKAGRTLGVDVELIERRDYARLAEYDALFIRDTTRIDHYTYRFAKKAESEEMVVLDDPRSILLCTNKVYLAELLRAKKVPTPKTVIVGKGDLSAAQQQIGFPMVLKVPDGSFSQGVFKVEDAAQMREVTARLFRESELILAQEYLYTEFDWRVGILNRQPLFVSQYFMSKKHWQIVKYDGKGGFSEGGFRTLAVEQAPAEVVSVALKAANLIGDGLYGVDLKQNSDGVYVIEVNDNPNLDAGVEDVVLKEELYAQVMAEFVRRLDVKRRR
ncbi:MAG: RimK family protein, partial [Gammaproteobacteria bacterium]|nr:RimK family protein [Gammaproteobacteria bacterium]MCW8839767.1 RimK family protein [Gammaproteobacteria bacterium]MCW8927693.1 RimK family protein [Gammaproteobacteria bacterium]MCW8958839.1 RimK family protein [Gammaproteobacteria bacterium]MCW8971678.1 RimK family protein [Gammaproteobacteria bacterium]